MKFNWEVENHYIDDERVCFRANGNFVKSGSIVERYFRGRNETVYLSNGDIRLISSTLIYALKCQYNVSAHSSNIGLVQKISIPPVEDMLLLNEWY